MSATWQSKSPYNIATWHRRLLSEQSSDRRLLGGEIVLGSTPSCTAKHDQGGQNQGGLHDGDVRLEDSIVVREYTINLHLTRNSRLD